MDSKMTLEAEIDTLNSEAIKGIREASKIISNVAEGLKLDFEASGTGYKARVQSLGKEAIVEMKEELRVQRESFRMSVEELRNFIKRSVSDVENLKKSTWGTAKLVGFNFHLTRLARIVAGEQVGAVEALATMKMTVDAFTDYLALQGHADRCPSARVFSTELRRIIT